MKRIISLVLSLIIMLSLVCVAVPSVSASSAMRASDSCVNMIKSFEGFSKYPYQDSNYKGDSDPWYVGYGTRVSGDDLAYYKTYGITEEQAVTLLKQFVILLKCSHIFTVHL